MVRCTRRARDMLLLLLSSSSAAAAIGWMDARRCTRSEGGWCVIYFGMSFAHSFLIYFPRDWKQRVGETDS